MQQSKVMECEVQEKKKNLRLTRKRAGELVAELINRVERINASDEYLHCVRRVSVFGSYLTDKERLGDLDVAVQIERKCQDGGLFVKMCLAMADAEGTRSDQAMFLKRLFYAEKKCLQAIRGGSRAISLHHHWELDQIVEEGKAEARLVYPVAKEC